ncbi:MAG: cation:proton antiporter [Chloroflexota bacterium]
MPDLLIALALVAAVLVVAALASGIVERTPVSFPMIFLALGFLLSRLGLLRIGPHDAVLETVAILSLSFVLFLDALNLRLEDLGKDWVVPVLSLGPGTVLTVVFVTLAASLLLGTPPLQSLLLGAILASVDPVLLRDVVRDERIPRSVRLALRTEAGTNDLVVLPIILVLVTIALGQGGGLGDWLLVLGRLFLLGPLVGGAIGAASVVLMNQAQARTKVSRAYQALYGVGTLLAAYVAGEETGSSGFLAVFTAGLVVVLLDFDLCDCFLEYGEATAEMTMLLAFTLFGALLSATIASVPLVPTLALAFIVLAVARPLAINLVLLRAPVSRRARVFIGWFGPRGLSTLLFGLLLVISGVPDAERLLSLAGVVVIVSVVLHGVSAAPLATGYARAVARETLPEEREGTAVGLFRDAARSEPRIEPGELAERLAGANPPIVLDVRTRSSYFADQARIPGSVRVPPDQIAEWAAGQSRERGVIAYCT